MIKALEPYLSEQPSKIRDDVPNSYICLKVHNTAFTTTNVPKDLGGEKGGVWHVHIEQDGVGDLEEMVQWLKPQLQKAVAPAVFRWKLEGGE
jgi:hypothetical protein